MKEPIWIQPKVVFQIHRLQIDEHGGSSGVRDENVIQSALDRPKNLFLYGKKVDVARLASAYLIGLAKNHGFIDGNKRVAAVVTELFLELNGFTLTATDEEWYQAVIEVATTSVSEPKLSSWIRSNIEPISG